MAFKREKVIRTAEKLVAKGKLENAIKEYRKVLAENPNDANTLNRVGDLYARIEKFDEAVKLFSQIADQYTTDGFFVKAIAIYKKIIKLAPQSLQVYERLAELYHKQGLLNESRTQYQILADHYEKRDNATSAVTIYQRMVEIDPDNPSHHLKLAQLYERQQLTDKALRAYRQLADLFLVNGSIDEATQVYLSALDAHHQELEFVREVIQGLHGEGHVEAAEKVLAKAKALNPEAEAVGRDVFGDPAADHVATPEVMAEEPVAEAEPFRTPEPETAAFDEPATLSEDEITFDVDDTDFELPEVPDPVEVLPEDAPLQDTEIPVMTGPDAAPLPSPVESLAFGSDDDDSVFTLDLDDDEPMATQVMPPPDMLQEPAVSEEFAGAVDDDEPGLGPTGSDLADIGENLGAAELGQALAEQEAPEEIDWSIDEDAEEIEIELESEEFELELEDVDDELVAEAPEPQGEQTPFPNEETSASEAAAPGTAAPGTAAPGTAAPGTMARHEDDLLAEAKVFAKYGLYEKAEDRIQELLDIQPEHLGGLCLLARIELDSGRHEQAVAHARDIARVAAASPEPGPWTELHEAFAKAGHPIDDGDVAAADAAMPADGDRFARLLEDLDETSTGLTVTSADDAQEQVLLEPERQPAEPLGFDSEELPEELTLDLEPPAETTMDEAVEPAVELEPVELEPVELEPVELEPAELEPAELEPTLPDPVASEPDATEDPGLESASFDESIFDLEEEIFEAEPVEAKPVEAESVEAEPVEAESVEAESVEPEPAAGPDPVAESSEEPFSELEALMQSVTRDAGFEEFNPEETSLEDLVPLEDEPAEEVVDEPPPPPTADQVVSLVDELDLGGLSDDLDAELSPDTASVDPAAGTEVPTDGGSGLDETGMSWLDDVAAPAAEAGEDQEESIFDEEDNFFDLAAELEAEMSGSDDDIDLETPQEQSLEEIIDGFKRGVAENLSTEDYDTHYNLGIAYREMGLLDEAIGEFQLASKDPRHMVDCSSMLGMCFLEKGLPELAVRWYKKGLESPALGEEQALGLLYDMGMAYVTQGDNEAAYRTFVEIYGMNSNYRDVAQRIQELQQTAASS